MTLPKALPSSTGTHHRMHTVLIDQYSFGMHSIGCSSTHLLLKLLLIYGSVFVSSALSRASTYNARQTPLAPPLYGRRACRRQLNVMSCPVLSCSKYVSMCLCVNVCMCICVYVYMCTCVYVYMCIVYMCILYVCI